MEHPQREIRITKELFYRLSERKKRISIDIDSVKQSKLAPIKAFFNLKHLFPNCRVKMDRTRHGFHVKAIGEEIMQIPINKRVDIREQMGDDSKRIDYDRYKLRLEEKELVDTLFSIKKDYDGKISVVEPMNPIALPFASRIPAKKPHSSRIFRALS